MRAPWTKSFLEKSFLFVAPVILLIGTWAVARSAVDQLLVHDAVFTGHEWTAFLVDNVKDLEAIAQGAKPSEESERFFDEASKAGQVFRYVIYDPSGHTRFASDSPRESEPRASDAATSAPSSTDDDETELAEHNPAAARVLQEGKPVINAEEGTPPGRPTFFSEAYLPAVKDGRTVAIVETYIDQADKRDAYRHTLYAMGVALTALVGFAFGAPAFAWIRRSNEKRLADAHIRYLAHHDSLTGLPNRARLSEEATARLARLGETGGLLALHYVDLDDFKDINDTLGHDAGDALLAAAAHRLQALIGPRDCVARFGGDEFVVIQDAQDESRVRSLADAVRESLSRPFTFNGAAMSVSASVGVAMAPDHGGDLARLMKSADLARYASKRRGGDVASVFSTTMEEELAKRLSVEHTVRGALANRAFELHFQPVVETRSASLVGFEALLRMRDERGALVSPALFIPVAEEIGLIDEIGEWVLREACSVASAWPRRLKIAVNLSPAQFARRGLADRVSAILAETGLPPGNLELEITEGLLLRKSDDVMGELRALKALGVGVVMDDFGTGYSSLSYLWQFPFDKIKIDRAFMLALDAEPNGNAATIVRTIIELGRSLNVTVTVEGVETESQLAFVSAANCDQIQGYIYGKPMPAHDVAVHLLRQPDLRISRQLMKAG